MITQAKSVVVEPSQIVDHYTGILTANRRSLMGFCRFLKMHVGDWYVNSTLDDSGSDRDR